MQIFGKKCSTLREGRYQRRKILGATTNQEENSDKPKSRILQRDIFDLKRINQVQYGPWITCF